MNIAGKKIPTWLLWGGGLGAGIVGIAYFRSRKSSSGAAASSAAASGVDPVTGLPFAQDNQTDPLTGMTYLAEAQQYGSVSAAEAALAGSGSAYSASGQSPYVGTAGYPTSNVGSASGTVQSYATNAAWSQAVTAGLVALGYSAEAVAAALGLYFQEHPLSADQASIVQAAIAEYGPPPQGSYPIIATTSTAGPPAAGGGTTGGGHPAAKVPAMPGGVHASAVSSSGFTLAWSPSAGATGYVVRVTYQGAVAFSDKVSGTSAHVTGLGPNRSYTAHVAAENSAGTSPETNGPGVKTTK